MSPREAQYLPSSASLELSFFPSKSSYRVFCKRTISDGDILLIAFSTSSPLVLGMNKTFFCSSSLNLVATGAKSFLAKSLSSLIRPK